MRWSRWTRRWTMGMPVVVCAAACGGARGHVAAPRCVPADAPAREPRRDTTARYYPAGWPSDADGSAPKLTRRPNAVLLFARPTAADLGAWDGMGSVPRLTFQPVLCTIRGKLATGLACGESMPAEAQVRATGAYGPGGLEVERSKLPFRIEVGDGPVSYPAPYAPACCNDKVCSDKTIPYRLVEPDATSFTVTTRSTLAVWPKDADVGVVSREDGVDESVAVSDATWAADARSKTSIHQVFALGARRYAAVGDSLFWNTGSGWRELDRLEGQRRHHVIATSDIDGDQRPELLVYAEWSNGYGLFVLANDATMPVHQVSCGNI